MNVNELKTELRQRLLSSAAVVAVLAAGMAIAPVQASAQTVLQWDADGTAPVNGGSGIWNTANTNWFNGATYQTWSGFGLEAVFGGTAGTVEIDESQNVGFNALTFNVDGYMLVDDNLTGGALTNGGPGSGPFSVQVTNAAHTATINADILADSLAKIGSGTLVLGGSNSFDIVDLRGGTLSVGSLANLGTPDFISGFGGTLHTSADIATAATVVLFSQGLTFDTAAGTTLTLNGVVQNPISFAPGTLTKTGDGTLVLTAVNTYSRGTNINGGTVQVTADNNLGAAAGPLSFDGGTLKTSGSFTTTRATTLNAGGGTFEVDSTTILTHDGIVSGAGALTKTGGGELKLSGTNTYTGPTNINDGTVETSDTSALGVNSAVTVNSPGELEVNSSFLNIGSLAGDGSVVFEQIAASLTTGGDNTDTEFSGVISGTNGSLNKVGTGVFTLSGANTFGGQVVVNGGTLAVEGGSAIADATNVNISAAGTLRVFAQPETVAGIGNVGGTIDMQDGNPDDMLTGSAYQSSGGRLLVDAQLNTVGGTADKLQINGNFVNTAGATQIFVNDVGNGSGSTAALTVASVTGTTNDGDFVLGDDVISGPLQYSLLRQGQDWNLVAGLLSQSFVAPALQAIVSGDTSRLIGTLETRRTAAYGAGREPVADFGNPYTGSRWGTWIRMSGSKAKADGALEGSPIADAVSYDSTFAFIQGGVSASFYDDGASKLIASVFGHYADGDADVADDAGAYQGSIANTNTGVGGSLTWLATSGFYADLVGLASWHDIDTTTSGAATGSTDGDTLAGSLELGFSFRVSDMVNIVPQAQVIYQRTRIDTYTDSQGVTTAFPDADNVEGRFGVAVEHVSVMTMMDATFKANGAVNVLHDFTNESDASINGTLLGFDADGTELMIGGGFAVTPNGNGFRLGFQGDYTIPLDDEGREGFTLETTAGIDF